MLGRSLRLALSFFILLTALACAKRVYYAPPEPAWEVRYREVGLASWYGEDFHGRRTANGEVYDMYAMTAAHRTLPFNTRVRVTNLDNGRRAEFRINDRGPFDVGRIIDLSKKGAQELGMIGSGTARVVVEVTGMTPGKPSLLRGTYVLQVGAFVERENAYRFQRELARKHSRVHVLLWETNTRRFYRVRLGAFPTEEEARRYLENLRKENLQGFVVRED